MPKSATSSRPRYRFQYAVKFICTANIPGTSQTTDSFLPGSYQTAVNIHNPQTKKILLRQKIASAIGISKFFESVLEPDGVTGVTCGQIGKFGLHLIHGFEGFLVIESTNSLDVVAVYTAAPNQGQVSSIDVEQIKERRI